MQPIVDYILKNKEWIFSGVGVSIVPIFLFLLRLFFRRSNPNDTPHTSQAVEQSSAKKSDSSETSIPGNWHGILPSNTKYKFTTKKTSFIPLGTQSFSFEYGPHGHARPLTLKGSIVRAEIQFACRIFNPHDALFAANEYCLNVLQPKFLIEARLILEQYSLTKLRAARKEIAEEIKLHVEDQFAKLGVLLESVTIGALDKLEHTNA